MDHLLYNWSESRNSDILRSTIVGERRFTLMTGMGFFMTVNVHAFTSKLYIHKNLQIMNVACGGAKICIVE